MTDTEPAYKPSLAEVAALVPSRAKGSFGRIETFTADTQPTATQVQSLIDRATGKLIGKLGDTVPDALLEDAKDVVALRAAMFVELTFFGDQIASNKGPYTELKDLYEEALADYIADRRDLGADQEAGTADDLAGGGLPSYSFPLLTGPVRAPGTQEPFDGGGLDW